MNRLLAVGCGGALGSLGRYTFSAVLGGLGAEPWFSTLVINLVGSALIGWGFLIIEGALQRLGAPGRGRILLSRRSPSVVAYPEHDSAAAAALVRDAMQRWSAHRAFWLTGVLGGFTTFSTFSLDVVTLIQESRFGMAVLLIVLSVVGCALGTGASVLIAGGQLRAVRSPSE